MFKIFRIIITFFEQSGGNECICSISVLYPAQNSLHFCRGYILNILTVILEIRKFSYLTGIWLLLSTPSDFHCRYLRPLPDFLFVLRSERHVMVNWFGRF
jgi:hypothetical protein